MEIDISDISKNGSQRFLLVGLIFAFVMVILGLVGRPYTTFNQEGYPKVVSWSDWRMFLAEQAYQEELGRLWQEGDLLMDYLNTLPDPVRAQLALERIEKQYRAGVPVLEYQRSLLLTATQDVQRWSVGAVNRDQALSSVNAFVEAVKLPEAETQPEEQPAATPEALMFLPVVLAAGQPALNLLSSSH